MSTYYPITLSPGTNQKTSVVLGDATYHLTFIYRGNFLGGWVMDIDDQNDNPIVAGIPLVTGANLLENYGYLGFTGGMCVVGSTTSGGDTDELPTFDDLGADAQLYWVTTP